jgi:hypothetical protein
VLYVGSIITKKKEREREREKEKEKAIFNQYI